jgi:hypothetical protein
MSGEIIIQPEQREILAQALADAEYYRDPPLHCLACGVQDTLCDHCAADLARARSYLSLSRTLGIQKPE